MILSQLHGRVCEQFNPEDLLFHAQFEVEKHIVKKNNRPIFRNKGKIFLGKSTRLRSAEQHMYLKLREAAAKFNLKTPINVPVWCIFHFHFKDFYTQKGLMSKTMPDLSNLYGLPEDVLQEANILVDDNLIMSHDLSRRLPAQKNELQIFILKHADRI